MTIQTEVVPLGEIFEGNLIPEGLTSGQFHIPPIQREYQWGVASETDPESLNRSARQYLEDSLNFFELTRNDEDPDPYFMGTMIAYRDDDDDEGVYRLMDGQQRWTTTLAMMSAIWNILDRDSDGRADSEDHPVKGGVGHRLERTEPVGDRPQQARLPLAQKQEAKENRQQEDDQGQGMGAGKIKGQDQQVDSKQSKKGK